MPENTRLSFYEVLNSEFKLAPDAGETLTLVLKEVSEIKKSGSYESFSIEFHGPKDALLKQGTYELTHDTLGTKTIFMVPVGEGDDRYEYQAVFSSMPQKIEE